MKSYRDLKFWDRAHRLVVRTFEVTRGFPKEELINLTSAIRRTVVGVAAPLVESFAIGGERESIPLIQNTIIATGTIEYQLLLARDLGYLDETTFDELTSETLELRRQLTSHLMKLRTIR